MQRRDFLATSMTAAASIPLAASLAEAAQDSKTTVPAAGVTSDQPPRKGHIRHAVSQWCFGGMPLDELCRNASAMGIEGIDLLSENDWETPRKYGMLCSLANGPTSISDGMNRLANHDRVVAECERMLPLAANAGVPNLMLFSGNRKGMSDDEGLKNCVIGLKRVMPLAEKHGVTILMELLNSRVDHGDYMCDRTPWGVELVKRVGSDRFRMLYDIYHMQIMEGDVIRTIRDIHQYIGHYHTAGNPGRNEIDNTQELFYPPICRAIIETGFKGFLAQEFIPRRDPMTSLRESIDICDV
jgi:hydroxypyruvate isomerase